MSTGTDRGAVAVDGLHATDEGVFLVVAPLTDLVVDVRFDGRRVWSFWTVRDTQARGRERFVRWPDALRRFLDGAVKLSLVDHVSAVELASTEVRLGSGAGRISVVDKEGRPLGLDKSLTLARLFDSRSEEQLLPLLSSTETVLEALRTAGIEPFVAYGTLLGAVREGGLIGHDSDADLGYVSRHQHPVDVTLESFGLQRRLVEQGFSVTRYSGLAFRVNVVEGDGAKRGLDVFGGFLSEGHLYLMGEVGSPFREEWVWPLSTVTLEGRRLPAPAQPERLLEAMYGPGWRTPDPAFKFHTPRATVRRLDGWFRGTRGGRNLTWHKPRRRALRRKIRPSSMVAWVREQEPEIGTFVDVGCGSGSDAYWMARRGTSSVGLDFRPSHYELLAAKARRRELPVEFDWANLNELRSVLATGAELARRPGPRVMMARHVVDALDTPGREHFLRLARMVCRDSGRLYLQVQRASAGTPADVAPAGRDNLVPMDVDALVSQVEASGGRVERREEFVESRRDSPQGGTPRKHEQREVARLVVTWLR